MRVSLCPLLLAGALAVAAAGCGPRPAAVPLAVCTALQEPVEQVATEYMRRHPEARVTVFSMDSAAAIHAVAEGIVPAAIADAVTLPPEAAGMRIVSVARDGIAVIVHPDNPVSTVSAEQVRALFSGTLRSWQEAGGAVHGVNVVVRERGSGTRNAFEELLGGVAPNSRVVIQDTSRSVLETVAADPFAVAYLSQAVVDGRVRALTVDGVACTPETVRTGRYPLVKPVRLLSRGPPAGAAGAFAAFLLSAEGADILAGRGLVPEPAAVVQP